MSDRKSETPSGIWGDDAYEQSVDFAGIVARSIERHGSNIYLNPLEADIDPISFESLGRFVRGFEVFLEENGVGEGDACAIVAHNSTALVLQFVALLATGRTFVPINPNSTVSEINFILEDSAPKCLLYNSALEEKVDAIHDWCSEIEIPSDAAFIAEIMARGEQRAELAAQPGPDTTGEIVYTSGTTGRPKGVQLTHRNLITDVFGLGQIFGFTEEDTFLTVAPLFHNSGQILTTLTPLYCGGTTTAIRSDMGFINFWHYVDEFKPTWTLVMPAHVALMLERSKPAAFKGIEGILCGGAPLQKEVQLAFEEKFSAPLYPNYGLTESTSVATCARPDEDDRYSGSAGRPLAINEVKIFNKDQEVADGVVGEVRIRGNNICAGYLNLPELTAEKIKRGWLHTGDLGYIKESGALQIVDRLDNMVIVGGENVYPTEVERLLPGLEALQEGILLSLPDKIMGRELVLVYRSDQGDARVRQWRDVLLEALTNFKVPRRFVNVEDLGFEEFPKAANGKVQRSKLQRALEEHFGVAEAPQPAAGDTEGSFVTDKTKAILMEILQLDHVRYDQNIDNTPSWDSVNHLTLIMALEQTFGVSFSATQIADMTSLEAIANEIKKLNPR